jgi:hypothetical protein
MNALYTFRIDDSPQVDEVNHNVHFILTNKTDEGVPVSPSHGSEEKKKRSIFGTLSGEVSHPEKYYLHAIVQKKDMPALKKMLTKRKVIEQLNSLNESQQTALRIY